jgi:hypothetical protein
MDVRAKQRLCLLACPKQDVQKLLFSHSNRNFDEANITTPLPKGCGTSPNFTVCTADRKKENPSVNTSDTE